MPIFFSDSGNLIDEERSQFNSKHDFKNIVEVEVLSDWNRAKTIQNIMKRMKKKNRKKTTDI